MIGKRLGALNFNKFRIFLNLKHSIYMIIVDVKDNESIEKALKRYRRKYRNVGVLREIRRRKEFTKPSVKRRNEILNAIYREENYGDNDA